MPTSKQLSCKKGNFFNFLIVKVKVKLSLCCFLNWAPRHESVMGEWRYSSTHFDLGTIWRWVVSFTPRPLYPQGKRPWYPWDRWMCEPQSRSGRGVEEKNSQPPLGFEPRSSDRPVRSQSLYRLRELTFHQHTPGQLAPSIRVPLEQLIVAQFVKKIPRISCNPKEHHGFLKSSPLDPNLSHINTLHTTTPHLQSVSIFSHHVRLCLASGLFLQQVLWLKFCKNFSCFLCCVLHAHQSFSVTIPVIHTEYWTIKCHVV
jgi:hypothetical protein